MIPFLFCAHSHTHTLTRAHAHTTLTRTQTRATHTHTHAHAHAHTQTHVGACECACVTQTRATYAHAHTLFPSLSRPARATPFPLQVWAVGIHDDHDDASAHFDRSVLLNLQPPHSKSRVRTRAV